MKLHIVILSLLLGASFATQGQTLLEVEQQISVYLDGISYWRFEYSAEDTSFGHEVNPEDSVSHINNALYNYIKEVVVKVPGILKRPPKLPENSDMKIVSSADKKFCIYSWDTHTGGSMKFYNVIGLYQKNGSVSAIPINDIVKNKGTDPAGSCDEILTVTSSSNERIYMAIFNSTLGTNYSAKVITAYRLENNQLNEVEIFITDDSKDKSLTYEYDYMSNYDFEKMKEINTVHLSKNGKKLYVPDVQNNQMTGEWQIYNFDGSKFVYDKTGK